MHYFCTFCTHGVDWASARLSHSEKTTISLDFVLPLLLDEGRVEPHQRIVDTFHIKTRKNPSVRLIERPRQMLVIR